jgi:hypothetical protein
MSHLSNALRAATAAALMGSSALAGAATATADPNTGSSSDINTLAAALSKGYGLNNCQPAQLTGSLLAELDCGQSPDSSGPTSAVYQLFKNAGDLNSAYASNIHDVTLTACSDGGSQSPGTWHQASSDQTAGQVACGTYKNLAAVVWTIDSKNVEGSILSKGDVPSLYKWWQANG